MPFLPFEIALRIVGVATISLRVLLLGMFLLHDAPFHSIVVVVVRPVGDGLVAVILWSPPVSTTVAAAVAPITPAVAPGTTRSLVLFLVAVFVFGHERTEHAIERSLFVLLPAAALPGGG